MQQLSEQLPVHHVHPSGHRPRQRDHLTHQHSEDPGQLLRRAPLPRCQGALRQRPGENTHNTGR